MYGTVGIKPDNLVGVYRMHLYIFLHMSISVAHPRVGVLPNAPTASHTSIGDVGEGLFDGIIGGRLDGVGLLLQFG